MKSKAAYTADSPQFRDLIREESAAAGLGEDVTVNIEVLATPDRWGVLQARGTVLRIVYAGVVIAATEPLKGVASTPRNLRVMRKTFRRAAKSIKNFSVCDLR